MASEWLIDKEYLESRNFHNKEYLVEVGSRLYNYCKFAPIQVMASYDTKNIGIFVLVGSNKQGFILDDKIHPVDYINMIKYWLEDFYISFVVLKKKPFNDGTLKQVPVDYKVVKTAIQDDEFVVRVGGPASKIREVRISSFPLSAFMKELRFIDNRCKNKSALEKSKELYGFIKTNSKIVKVIKNKKNLQYAEYVNKYQIDNFFIINWDRFKLFDIELEENIINFGYKKIYIEDKELQEYFLRKLEETK